MQLLESFSSPIRDAFQLPSKSVMCGLKPQKPRQNVPAQHIVVVGAKQGRIDTDRRMALKRAAI